jgi:hypothetical protein
MLIPRISLVPFFTLENNCFRYTELGYTDSAMFYWIDQYLECYFRRCQVLNGYLKNSYFVRCDLKQLEAIHTFDARAMVI